MLGGTTRPGGGTPAPRGGLAVRAEPVPKGPAARGRHPVAMLPGTAGAAVLPTPLHPPKEHPRLLQRTRTLHVKEGKCRATATARAEQKPFGDSAEASDQKQEGASGSFPAPPARLRSLPGFPPPGPPRDPQQFLQQAHSSKSTPRAGAEEPVLWPPSTLRRDPRLVPTARLGAAATPAGGHGGGTESSH